MSSKVFFVALCHDCGADMPVPFGDARSRAQWVVAHREATGHLVTIHDERRDNQPRDEGVG